MRVCLCVSRERSCFSPQRMRESFNSVIAPLSFIVIVVPASLRRARRPVPLVVVVLVLAARHTRWGVSREREHGRSASRRVRRWMVPTPTCVVDTEHSVRAAVNKGNKWVHSIYIPCMYIPVPTPHSYLVYVSVERFGIAPAASLPPSVCLSVCRSVGDARERERQRLGEWRACDARAWM